MKRILILGSVGSGKSTLAHKLNKKLRLPIICLDQYFWKPNWETTEEIEWREKVTELVKGEGWIMEGNYRNTLDIRLPIADTIILMDRSRFLCLYRLIKRIVGKREYGNIDGCKERINLKLLIWILWKFPQESRKEILTCLTKLKGEKEIFIFKSNDEIEEFLNEM